MRTALCILALFITSSASIAETSPDSQLTQAMLSEVRQLRLDLQTAAATIQRVQIGMYRLQVQAGQLARAKERLEQSRFGCDQAPRQQQQLRTQIEQFEARKRKSQNSDEQAVLETSLSQLRSELEEARKREQECQVERAEAETQLRTEEAKMNDLQDQLDRFDKFLAGLGRK